MELFFRYDRLGSPLWIHTKFIPEPNDIPLCQYCGKQRNFEFQVCFQKLYYFVYLLLLFIMLIDNATNFILFEITRIFKQRII